MRTLTAGLLCAALACPASAHVEKQFELPDFLRQPFYDIEIEAGPLLGLENIKPDNVVSLNHIGRMLKCVVPEVTTNATVQPLTDEAAISQARAILKHYKNTTLLYLDDVWGWHFAFDDDIVQFFPEEGPEPGTFHLSASSFQVHIGKNDNYPGHVSLDDAYPVIIDDQYMLYTRFVNGTQCDLTMEPRLANVYFACSLDAEPNVPLVLSIDEPYSCTYEFVIGLRELCDVDAFKSPEVPVNIIRCGTDPDFVEEPVNVNEDPEYDGVELEPESSEPESSENESYDPRESPESLNGNEHFEPEHEILSAENLDSQLDESYESPSEEVTNDQIGEVQNENSVETEAETENTTQQDSSESYTQQIDEVQDENSTETYASELYDEHVDVEQKDNSEPYTDYGFIDEAPLDNDDSRDQDTDSTGANEQPSSVSDELPEHNEL